MAKRLRHVSREYFGEREAHDIIEWMNEFGSTRRGRPVLRLWEAYNRYVQFLLTNVQEVRAVIGKEIGVRPEVSPVLDRKAEQHFRQLDERENREFRRKAAKAWEQCHATATEEHFAFEFLRRITPQHLLVPKPRQALERKTAGQAAFELYVLSHQPAFHKIRQCQTCRRFFYARFKHKKFCSVKCQQKYYKQSPEWKAYRAGWMRTHRVILKTKNVK
ncbi:MAG: hypothetical protein LAP13_07905 [Acidobacteriia bacterium]|nr:hypothetical protein [Terriglobia bacterium]